MAKAEVVMMRVLTASGTTYVANCEEKMACRYPSDQAGGLRYDEQMIEYDRLEDPEVGEPWVLWLIDKETGLSFKRTTTPVQDWIKFWDDNRITRPGSTRAEENHGAADEDPFAAVRGR